MIPLDVPSANITCNIVDHCQLYEQPVRDNALRTSLCSNDSMLSSRSSSVSSVNLSSLSLASTSSSERLLKNGDHNSCATPNHCADSKAVHLCPQPSSLVVISRKRAFENLSALALSAVQPSDEYSHTFYPSVTSSKPSPDAFDDDGWGFFVDTPEF